MSLYDPKLERDNCGFGLLAHMEGEASHKLVRLAMSALARMQHRGGISADGKTGDGCGLLLQKPDSFYRAVAEEKGWHLGRNYAVGMLFLNPDPVLAQQTRDIIDEELTDPRLYRHRAELYRRGLQPHFKELGGGVWLSRQADMPLFELECLGG